MSLLLVILVIYILYPYYQGVLLLDNIYIPVCGIVSEEQLTRNVYIITRFLVFVAVPVGGRTVCI